MKPPCKKPCKECPFRRKSLPGYVGASTPKDFLATTMADVAMPCHSTVDYSKPNWRDTYPRTARHCAGALVFFANIAKVSRDRTRPRLPRSAEVLGSPTEFLDHHDITKAVERVRNKTAGKKAGKKPPLADGMTRQNDPGDMRCACPGCREPVTDDNWCFGCKFYVCATHDTVGTLLGAQHDIIDHWTDLEE